MAWTQSSPDKTHWTPARVKHRFLVIEDEEDIRESMRMVLALEGHDAETANSGMEGLRMLEAHRPDVVLIDIRMPGMNGYEVARRARNLPDGDMLKLVAVTAYGSPAERARAYAAGFDVHLTKPCSYAELIHAVDEVDAH